VASAIVRGSNDLDLEGNSWRETRVGANFVFVLFIFDMSDTVSALKLFVRVPRLGSFSRAGLEFGLPQPSASRIIRNFEIEGTGLPVVNFNVLNECIGHHRYVPDAIAVRQAQAGGTIIHPKARAPSGDVE
jgi:hypothetical protein